MSRYITPEWKKLVAERAFFLCEYCLQFEGHASARFQFEHIISLKHGGLTVLENLAFSCVFCNRNKGTDVGTLLAPTHFVRFFNPRIDRWRDHFEFSGVAIYAKTEIGEATIKGLNLNQTDRLLERYALEEAGFFPHPNAKRLIGTVI